MNKKINSIFIFAILFTSFITNLLFLFGSNLFPKEYLLRVKTNAPIKKLNIAGTSYGDIDEKINYETGYRELSFFEIKFLKNGWFVNLLKNSIAKVIGKKTQKLTLLITEQESTEQQSFNLIERQYGKINETQTEITNITNSNKKSDEKLQKYFVIQLDNKKFNLSIEYEK